MKVLQLVKRYDADSSDIDSVDLLPLLQYQGWLQASRQKDKPTADEVISLLIDGSGNDDALATVLRAIDNKVKETGWAQDPLNPVGVWLRAQMDTESNPRQAFLTEIRRSPGMRVTSPFAYQSILEQYQLGLSRIGAWEPTLVTQIPATPTSLKATGAMFGYSVNGDSYARIAKVTLESTDRTGGAQSIPIYDEVWIGAKGNRYGVTPANFIPIWPLASASYFGPDTTSSSDSTAINDNKIVCTFATDVTMNHRAIIIANDVMGSNFNDQRGKYIALMRAQTTDPTLVADVRIGHGYLPYTSQTFAFQPRVRIQQSVQRWHLYTLGQVKIPASMGHFGFTLQSSGFSIQAERISGSGNLEMDSIILIPAESSVHVKNLTGVFFGDDTHGGALLNILIRPDDKASSETHAIGASPPASWAVTANTSPDTIDWALPAGSGVIVCAADAWTTPFANAKTAVIYPTFYVYPRYSSLRGDQ